MIFRNDVSGCKDWRTNPFEEREFDVEKEPKSPL